MLAGPPRRRPTPIRRRAQALWRLAVALYRQGRFGQAGERLDDLLGLASRFAPGWALLAARSRSKSRLDAGNPEAGRADFAAAAALTSGSDTWVVPYRMAGADFQAQADAQVRVHDFQTGVVPPAASWTWCFCRTSRGSRGVWIRIAGGIWKDLALGAAIRTVCLAGWAGTSLRGHARASPSATRLRALSAEHREPLSGQGDSRRGDPQVGGRAFRRGSRVPRGDRDQGCARAARRGESIPGDEDG